MWTSRCFQSVGFRPANKSKREWRQWTHVTRDYQKTVIISTHTFGHIRTGKRDVFMPAVDQYFYMGMIFVNFHQHIYKIIKSLHAKDYETTINFQWRLIDEILTCRCVLSSWITVISNLDRWRLIYSKRMATFATYWRKCWLFDSIQLN